MNQAAEHKQIRAYLSERLLDESLTDDEIASLAAMPLISHLCARPAKNVDAFLRGLPDDLLDRLGCLALEFFDWADGEQPESWPVELHAITTLLYHAEAGYDVETDNAEIGQACARLSTLALVERGRRLGPYRDVAPYTLTRDPEVIPAIPARKGESDGH